MKYIKKIVTIICLLLSSYFLQAQTNWEYSLAQNYSLVIHGGSNLHDWTENVNRVYGTGVINWNNNGSFDLKNLKLTIEVNSITSTEGTVMNNLTHKALQSKHHPEITFMLTNTVQSIPADEKEHEIAAPGTLTIAGITQPVILHAMVKASEHGLILFNGSQSINMTDYQINPPTALFGALKVTNDIILQYKTPFTANNH